MVSFLLLAVGFTTTGCSTPPSVLPLLEASERTLREEGDRLDADAQRDARWIAQTREALHDAYQQDLAQRDELDREWVQEATQAYVVAREELVRHEMHLREQRQRRRDNLRAAADATRRAAAILMRQDRLMAGLVGDDLWSLLASE
ncbi:MAG: hypothetical protein ACODAQ_04355 [Phycisphaeraceae bacterium]